MDHSGHDMGSSMSGMMSMATATASAAGAAATGAKAAGGHSMGGGTCKSESTTGFAAIVRLPFFR
jgi:hypothetical protein